MSTKNLNHQTPTNIDDEAIFVYEKVLNDALGKWHSTNADWGGCHVWKVGNTKDEFVGNFIMVDDNKQLVSINRSLVNDDEYKDVISFEIDNDNIQEFLSREFLVKDVSGRGFTATSSTLDILKGFKNVDYIFDEESEGYESLYAFLSNSEIGNTYCETNFNIDFIRTK